MMIDCVKRTYHVLSVLWGGIDFQHEPFDFDNYAGYISVDQNQEKQLFYWLTESKRDSKTDPLVLWLNGGPRMFLFEGLFAENGPFTPVNHGKQLISNPYSWVRS